MTFIIAVISMLVLASVISKIFDPNIGNLSFILLAVFALGKSLGAYASMKIWEIHENHRHHPH